jgi:hypothetical protein
MHNTYGKSKQKNIKWGLHCIVSSSMSISEQYLLSSCEYLVLCPADFCSLWMATAIIDSKSMKDKSFLPDKTAFGWITYSVSFLHLSCHILWSQPGNSADLNRRWAFRFSQWAKNSACFSNRWICPSVRSSYGKKELTLFIPLTDQTWFNRKIHSCACFCVAPSVLVTVVISVRGSWHADSLHLMLPWTTSFILTFTNFNDQWFAELCPWTRNHAPLAGSLWDL